MAVLTLDLKNDNTSPLYSLVKKSTQPKAKSLLTIVIPAYNAEFFLVETLSKVILCQFAQIILIDDESSDNTLTIATRMLAHHPNYIILKLTHKGSPGAARNLGIELADSDFIWFLDCDDVPIIENAYDCVSMMNLLNLNMSIMNYFVRYDNNFHWEKSFDHPLFSKLCLSPYRIFSDWTAEPLLILLSPHPSRTIYRTTFLRDHKIRFDEDHNFEDGSFWPEVLSRCSGIMLWNYPSVVYRIRNSSITYSNEITRKLDLLTQMSKVRSAGFFELETNENLMFPTFLYLLEMVHWPITTLSRSVKRNYRKKVRMEIDKFGKNWFVIKKSSIVYNLRLYLKMALRIRSIKIAKRLIILNFKVGK